MDRRQKFDRRKTDRRERKRDSGLSKNNLVLLAMAILTIVTIYRSSASQHNSAVADNQLEIRQKRFVSKDYESFREEVKLRDQELLEKWREIKQSRKYNPNGPDHARRHFEQRLTELQDGLDRHKKSAMHKGSIGWNLQQDIKKLKADPPPR